MTSNVPITDELLSAYLDDAVTAEDRALVEDAAARDPDVAWRLSSLRYTVELLRQLPELSAPRAFTLTENQVVGAFEPAVAAAQTGSAATATARTRADHASWRTRLHEFWSAGSPVWRNAAAACAVLLLALLIGDDMFTARIATPVAVQGPAAELAAVSPADMTGNDNAGNDDTATTTAAMQAGATAEAPRNPDSADDAPSNATDAETAPVAKVAPQAAASSADDAGDARDDVVVSETPNQTARTGSPQVEAYSAGVVGNEVVGNEVVGNEAVASSATADPAPPAAGGNVALAPPAPALRDQLSMSGAPAAAAPGSDDPLEELFTASAAPPPMAAAALVEHAPMSATLDMTMSTTVTADGTDTSAAPMALSSTAALAAAPAGEAEAESVDASAATAAPAVTATTAPTPAAAVTISTPAQSEQQPPAPQAADTALVTDTDTQPTPLPMDWLRIGRLILAGLTVLFAVLWLVSRRATSPA